MGHFFSDLKEIKQMIADLQDAIDKYQPETTMVFETYRTREAFRKTATPYAVNLLIKYIEHLEKTKS